MQRLAAAALLAWVNFALIFAAIRPVVADSQLPACCRRFGQHGCAMTSPGSGAAFQAPLCPMYPQSGAVPAQAKANGLAAPVSTFAVAVSQPALQPQSTVHYRMSYSRAGQKRGPPVSLA